MARFESFMGCCLVRRNSSFFSWTSLVNMSAQVMSKMPHVIPFWISPSPKTTFLLFKSHRSGLMMIWIFLMISLALYCPSEFYTKKHFIFLLTKIGYQCSLFEPVLIGNRMVSNFDASIPSIARRSRFIGLGSIRSSESRCQTHGLSMRMSYSEQLLTKSFTRPSCPSDVRKFLARLAQASLSIFIVLRILISSQIKSFGTWDWNWITWSFSIDFNRLKRQRSIS